MKRLCLALCALLLIMTACSSNETEEIIGLNISGGNIVTASDTHGGFHGDGISYTAVSFEDDSALALVQLPFELSPVPIFAAALVVALAVVRLLRKKKVKEEVSL